MHRFGLRLRYRASLNPRAALLYGTLLACVSPPLFSECPEPVWNYALEQGVEIQHEGPLPAWMAKELSDSGLRRLRRGPVRLRLEYSPGSSPSWPALLELSLRAEAHASLGQAPLEAPCQLWRTLAYPSSRESAIRHLVNQWLTRWHAESAKRPEKHHDQDTLLPPLRSLWDGDG